VAQGVLGHLAIVSRWEMATRSGPGEGESLMWTHRERSTNSRDLQQQRAQWSEAQPFWARSESHYLRKKRKYLDDRLF
jgi:hypothetical protein